MALPDLRVEFDPAGSATTEFPAWQDLSPYVRLSDGVTYSTGRQDETTSIQAGVASLNLNNDGGIFTPGSNEVIAKWGQDLTIRVPIRLRARYGGSSIAYGSGPYGAGSYSPTISGNMLAAEDASFEGGTTGTWAAGGSVPPTLTNSTSHPQEGTKGLLITWGTGGFFPLAQVSVTGLVIGRYYTASAYVWVPSGSPDPFLAIGGVTTGTQTTTKNALTRISVTWLADANSALLQLWPYQAPTAGQTCYVDAVQVDEGTTKGDFTTAPPPLYDLWTGTVDEWVGAWTGGRRAVVGVRASDRWARLSRKSLRPMLDAEVLVDDPIGYWPLNDDSTDATAGDVSGNTNATVLTQTQYGSGGTLVFGSTAGPTPDGGSCAAFTRASANNGIALSGQTIAEYFSTGLTIEAWVNTSSAVDMGIVGLGNFILAVSSTGKLTARANVGFSTVTATSASNVSTGAWRHVVATLDCSAASMTLTIYMDGTNVGTATTAAAFTASGVKYIEVGGYSWNIGGGPYGGNVANVALYQTVLSSGRITAHYNAGLAGFTGDASDARFDRICAYAGIPASLYSSPEPGLTTMGVQPIGGKTVAGALQDVADTERGLVFVDQSGVTTFHARGHRYNTTPSFTLLGSDVSPSLEFTTDDQYLINDATVSRYGGGTKRVVNTDSVAQYDTYDVSLSLYSNDDTFTASLAQYLVNTYGDPSTRSSAVEVDLYTKNNTAPTSSILAATIGNRFTITALPDASSSPDTSIDLFIEGMSGSINTQQWIWRANASPAPVSSVWQLDSATYSQLDANTVLAF